MKKVSISKVVELISVLAPLVTTALVCIDIRKTGLEFKANLQKQYQLAAADVKTAKKELPNE